MDICEDIFNALSAEFAVLGDDGIVHKVLRLSPEKLRWYETVDAALAYKRCRPFFFGWLERAQTRLGSYGPDGAARTRDRDEFEIDFVGHNAASVSGA
mmetsp:Transcript_16104/g.46390  ORF Transcript_16104/g.46390 Transcript_16104/m.46390 type:complete len:98 (+) Transcript_16104:632-925(+)